MSHVLLGVSIVTTGSIAADYYVVKSSDLSEPKIKIRRAVDARSPTLHSGAEPPLSPTLF
jgi:hypothetical protein